MDFTGLLPNTGVKRLRGAVIVTCVSFLSFAVFSLYCTLFRSGSLIFCLLASALFAVIACYLWRLRSWARQAARFTIALLILLFVGGIYNPFFLMDYHPADAVDSFLWRYTLIMVPCVAVALWCLRILSSFREEFR
jgi:hypothetical protein